MQTRALIIYASAFLRARPPEEAALRLRTVFLSGAAAAISAARSGVIASGFLFYSPERAQFLSPHLR